MAIDFPNSSTTKNSRNYVKKMKKLEVGLLYLTSPNMQSLNTRFDSRTSSVQTPIMRGNSMT